MAGGRRDTSTALSLAALVVASVAGVCRPRPSTMLTLDVAPRAVAAGDTVRLALTLVNAQDDTLRLAFEPGCATRIAVRHATEGWHAHPVPDACAALVSDGRDSTRVVVPPRGTWRDERRWVARGEDARHPLVPGDYVVHASISQRVERRAGRSAFQLGQSAPEVTLRVRPAP